MDKKSASSSRKASRKPQRFQVDPLSVLATPVVIEPIRQSQRHARIDETPESPASQNIELLPLDKVEPDPWNPRHILPGEIRREFIAGKINAEAATKAWIKAGKSDKDISEQLQQFRSMGTSLQQQGQINPINVAKHFRKDGTFIWRIESGERRFWAKWLAIVEGITKERTIHAQLRDELDPTRQAVENLQAESLSAVGEARQIARLYLAELNITPESLPAKNATPGSDDYFRIALRPANEILAGRERLPRGYWSKLENIIGNKRQHLERKLQILKLPDHLLSLADLHRLTERQLREIIARHQKQWETLVHFTVQHDISGPELALASAIDDPEIGLQMILEMRSGKAETSAATQENKGETPKKKGSRSFEHDLQRRVVSFAKYFHLAKKNGNAKMNIDQVVDEIIESGNHQMVLESLVELESLINRLKKKAANLVSARD